MTGNTWFITSWDEYVAAEQDIGSYVYHLAEEVEDEGKKYQVTLSVEEIS